MIEHDERITRAAYEHRFGSVDVLGRGTISVLESKKDGDNGKRRAGYVASSIARAQQTNAYLGAEAYIWKAAFRVAIRIGGGSDETRRQRPSLSGFIYGYFIVQRHYHPITL